MGGIWNFSLVPPVVDDSAHPESKPVLTGIIQSLLKQYIQNDWEDATTAWKKITRVVFKASRDKLL